MSGRGSNISGRAVAVTGRGFDITDFVPIIIDDFEDGDLSEYNTDATIGSTTFEGSSSLQLDNDIYNYAFSETGLNRYPERGDTFEFYYHFTENNFNNIQAFFALQSLPTGKLSSSYSGYEIRTQNDGSGQYLQLFEDGNSKTAQKSVSMATNTWYRFEVSFNDPIAVEIFDPSDGSSVGSRSFSSTKYNNGVFGFQSNQNTAANRFIDFARVIQ